MAGDFPFVLSLSKHENHFFSSLLRSKAVKQNLAGQATLSPHWAVVVQFQAETEVEQGCFKGD